MSSIRKATHLGFSLIEILVVLAIISLTVSIVSLAIPSSNPTNPDLSEVMEQWLGDCIYEGRLSGSVLGLMVSTDAEEQVSLEAYKLNPRLNSWRIHRCFEQSKLTISSNKESVRLETLNIERDIVEFDNLEVPVPQILLLPSGEVTPFELTIFATTRVDVTSTGYGEILIETRTNG